MYNVKLTDPQSRFLLLEDKFPLFVAGFGSGKSTAQCVSIFNDLSIPHFKTMKIGAYAPTYGLLKLITIPYLCEFLENMGMEYKLNKNDYIITIEGGDQIILRSLDNPSRIVGYETFRSHIDEIDTLLEPKAQESWNKIIARNRQKMPVLGDDFEPVFSKDGSAMNYLNRVSAYTTPEGFRFAYNRWEKNPAKGYVKIQASTYSNQDNLPDDYIDSLRDSYPAGLVEAYIEGEFVNLVGKQVYPGFKRETHNSDAEVVPGDILNVGMDFNVVHGAAAIHVLRDDLPVAVDEIHDAYDTDEQIAILNQRYPGYAINIFPDATGERRTSANTTESDLAKLRNAGFNVICDFANPPIKDRVMSYNAMILNGKKDVKYRVNINKCPHLTNALEQQIWDKNGLPDKSSGLDHIVDGAGYYIFNKFGITKPTTTTTTTHARY